ncbi:recombinase family protein [Listeria booriae]|uniref:recombinase family protein n=1 Tax=Listeria booriae TaxID=1552123 RepID=UPI00162519C3|nr:recombinase family protein [Listeria booriae]MBC2392017.1 recombinase family protein [Listeria booriae]
MKGSLIVRVAIYLRKSRAEDGVQDLAKHKDYLLSICKKNNWQYELYEEIENSQEINRQELQRLRQDISLGKVDAVLINAVDRLSRKTRHFLEIIEDYFLDQGLTRLFVRETEYDLRDNNTITMLQLQATLSQSEYSFIVQRLNQGKQASLKKGIITGKVIYGYKRNKKTKLLEPEPAEAEIVRKIVDLLLQGSPYRAICDQLNSLGFRTRKGNLWDIHNVKSILHSDTLRGNVVYEVADGKGGKQTIEVLNSHEALITDAEYSKIKEITDRRAQSYKGLSKIPKHWLQGLLKCPQCHRVMTIAGTKPNRKKLPDGTVERSGEAVYYIRACREYLKDAGKRCINYGCQAKVIEEAISDIILRYKETINHNIQRLLQTDGKEVVQSRKNVVEELQRALTKLESKEETWLGMIGDDSVPLSTEDIFKQLNKIKDEKADMLLKLNEAKTELSTVDIELNIEQQVKLLDAMEQWNTLPDIQKRQTLQMLFKEIQYSRLSKDCAPSLEFETYE